MVSVSIAIHPLSSVTVYIMLYMPLILLWNVGVSLPEVGSTNRTSPVQTCLSYIPDPPRALPFSKSSSPPHTIGKPVPSPSIVPVIFALGFSQTVNVTGVVEIGVQELPTSSLYWLLCIASTVVLITSLLVVTSSYVASSTTGFQDAPLSALTHHWYTKSGPVAKASK